LQTKTASTTAHPEREYANSEIHAPPVAATRASGKQLQKIKPHAENNKVVKSKPISSWIKQWRSEKFMYILAAATEMQFLRYGDRK